MAVGMGVFSGLLSFYPIKVDMESDPRDCLIVITTAVPQIFSMPLFSTCRQQKITPMIPAYSALGEGKVLCWGKVLWRDFPKANHVEHLFQKLAIFLCLSFFIWENNACFLGA